MSSNSFRLAVWSPMKPAIFTRAMWSARLFRRSPAAADGEHGDERHRRREEGSHPPQRQFAPEPAAIDQKIGF